MQFEVTNRNIIRSATGSVPVRGGERAANPRPAIRPRGPADTDARPARRNRPDPSASGGSGCGAAPRLGSRPGPFPPRSQAAVSCVRPRLHPSARQPYAAGNSHLPAARAARSGRAALAAPSRRRVRHRRLPEAPVRRRKRPHAHGPSVRCRAMLRFCERRIRPLRSPGCRNPFRARPLRPDRPVRRPGEIP